jgi:hypothetical protein
LDVRSIGFKELQFNIFSIIINYFNLFFRNSDKDFNKMTFYNTAESRRVQFHIISPESLNLVDSNKNHISDFSIIQSPPKRKVGRPRANPAKRLFIEEMSTKSDDSFKQNDFLLKSHCRRATSSKKYIDLDSHQQTEEIQPCHSYPSEQIQLRELPPPKRSRKISAKFRCPACNKIYLGKNKMNNHFKLFPEHKPIQPENESLLYSHLMSLIHQKTKNEDKTSFFLKELSNFVEKMQKLTPKLITTNEENSLLQVFMFK